MKAVAAGDEVALQLMDLAVLLIAHDGAVAIEAHGLHVAGLVDRGQALGGAHFHQVARDLGLAVDHDALAAGQAVQVDAVALAAEQQLDAVVRQAFCAHAGVGTGLLQQVHRDLFEHAGISGDSCATCHDPHGSNNDRMLVAKLPFLCQRCHNHTRHPSTIYDNKVVNSSNRLYSRSCVTCHSAIHGSNHPSGSTFLRQ